MSMKGSGKPASFSAHNPNPRVPFWDIPKKCTIQGCKRHYRVKVYQTGPEYDICPKHRREQAEEEAERITAERNKDYNVQP